MTAVIRTRGSISFVLALSILLSAAGTSAAGPSIPAAAAPRFNDPLSRLRTVGIDTPGKPAPTESLRAAPEEPPDAAAGTPFTIIGETGAERLEEPDVDDIADPGDNRFDRQSSAPLDGEAVFSTGVAGAPRGRSLGDLARNLINQVPVAGGGGGPGGAGDPAAGPGRTNSALLSAAIESNLTELLITVLSPKFEADGLVTFSINGFGSFALLSTGETGGIFLVDMEGGTAIKIYDDSRTTAQSQGVAGAVHATNQAQVATNVNGVQRLLDFLDTYILPIATSPITLSVVALSLMVWVVWRLSAREP